MVEVTKLLASEVLGEFGGVVDVEGPTFTRPRCGEGLCLGSRKVWHVDQQAAGRRLKRRAVPWQLCALGPPDPDLDEA